MKIGFIGLGIMGESMCENIVRKHNDTVYCYDHKPSQNEKLAAIGAVPCADEIEIAKRADVIITMVPTSAHSRDVYTKILPFLGPGKTCVDMGTIDPPASVEIAETVKKTGAEFIDAPVLKSKPAAIAGKLNILVGGSDEAFEAMKPILLYMGEHVMHLGGNGTGLVMKICHNALLSQIQNGVNETATLAAKMGIDIRTFAQAISYGGAGNSYLTSKLENLANEDYTTAFSVQNEHKDVHICLNMAKEIGFPMPGEENVARVYDRALEMGLGKEDLSATIKVVRGE
jgi:3-hydroxyisobutyrate dehydrogenase